MIHLARALRRGLPATIRLLPTLAPFEDTVFNPPQTGWSDWRRWLFIQTQTTPNPSSLMFLPGQEVMKEGVREFASARDALCSPLAKKLFSIEGVKLVFFGSDFITVSKTEEYTWKVIKPDIFAAITEFFSSGEALFLDESADPATTIQDDDDEVVAAIKEILETRIRPAVQDDGGDVIFKQFDEETGVLTVRMVGACSGCPSSGATLKGGIENMLRHYIPEVKEVVEDTDEAEEIGIQEFNKLESQLSN
eukprot:g1983.t1